MNSENNISYKSTVLACYIGNITMASVINLLPILIVPLQEQFNISYERFGRLILINFITQVSVDIIFSTFIDKYGFRRFIVTSPILTIIGMLIFIFAPNFSENPYPLFVAGTIIYSGSCGLLELLLSPIINSIPTKEKSAAMSMLHSFYCWGHILVIIVTTLSLYIFGRDKWQFIMLGWLIFPIVDFFLFIKAPLAPPIPEDKRQGFKAIKNKSAIVMMFLLIFCGGAAELCMSQWASVFTERALGISKVFGDLLGVTMFAFAMGIGRLLYGKFGSKINIRKVLLCGASLAVICYLTIALSGNNALAVAACALTGLAVSLLWPGTLVMSAETFPLAGAWIFALLAAAGDLGCSIGPWVMGKVVDGVIASQGAIDIASKYSLTLEQLGLKLGFGVSSLFPFLAVIVIIAVSCRKSSRQKI